MLHGSQEGGKGLGRLKMKHERGFGCFMVPMSGVGGVGKAKNEASKRVCVFLMVRKSGVGRVPMSGWVGRVWEGQKRSTKMNLGVSHGSQE